jgi:hypothetical protein
MSHETKSKMQWNMCKVIGQNAKEHAKSSGVKHKEIRAKE